MFVIGTVLIGAGMLWFFNAKVRPTFQEKEQKEHPGHKMISGLTLDANGELLMELKEKASLDQLRDELQQYGLTVEKKFFILKMPTKRIWTIIML